MRTTVTLPDHDHALAKRKAASIGISLSEYICQLVVKDLSPRNPTGGVSAIFGMFSTGRTEPASKREMISDAIDKHYTGLTSTPAYCCRR